MGVEALLHTATHVLTDGSFQGHPPWMSASSQQIGVRGWRNSKHAPGTTAWKLFTFNGWELATWIHFNTKAGMWSPVGQAIPDNNSIRIKIFCGQLSISSTRCSLKSSDIYTKEIL